MEKNDTITLRQQVLTYNQEKYGDSFFDNLIAKIIKSNKDVFRFTSVDEIKLQDLLDFFDTHLGVFLSDELYKIENKEELWTKVFIENTKLNDVKYNDINELNILFKDEFCLLAICVRCLLSDNFIFPWVIYMHKYMKLYFDKQSDEYINLFIRKYIIRILSYICLFIYFKKVKANQINKYSFRYVYRLINWINMNKKLSLKSYGYIKSYGNRYIKLKYLKKLKQ